MATTSFTKFIGRTELLTSIKDWFRDKSSPLLTLHDYGGIGKARLAIEASNQFEGRIAISALDSNTIYRRDKFGQSLTCGAVSKSGSVLPRPVSGNRRRGAAGKTPVFGLLKRQGRVYTEVVPDCRKVTLQAISRGRVAPEVAIHSDGWRGYDGLRGASPPFATPTAHRIGPAAPALYPYYSEPLD